MGVTIGRMNKRITFQNVSETADGMGGVTELWVGIATVWAALEPLKGSELFHAQQVESKITHKCTVRYRDGLNPAKRIKYGSRVFDIHSIIDVDEAHKYLEIHCSETLEII